MHLYAGKTLLAIARIPLSSLATVTTVTDEYPLVAEGTNVAIDTCPVIAVTVSIATEVSLLPDDDNKPLPLATLSSDDDNDDVKSSNSSHSNSIKSARQSLSEQFDMVTMEAANQESSKCSSPASSLSISQVPPSTDLVQAASFSNSVHHAKQQELATVSANQNQTLVSTNQDKLSNATNQNQIPNPTMVSTNEIHTTKHTNVSHVADQSEGAHHFCVTIDVRSLRLLVDHMSNNQLNGRYSYPFFGTSQSVILPAIKPLPYMECLFDQSYCAFDFATPREVLMTQLNSVPLVIELLENNSSVVAIATLMMSVILTQPIQTLTGGVKRQYYDSKVAVVTR